MFVVLYLYYAKWLHTDAAGADEKRGGCRHGQGEIFFIFSAGLQSWSRPFRAGAGAGAGAATKWWLRLQLRQTLEDKCNLLCFAKFFKHLPYVF